MTIGVRRTPMAARSIALPRLSFLRRGASRGRKRECPGVAATRNRLEPRECLVLREAQEQLPDMLAEVLAVHELFPVRAVMDDCPVDRINLDAIVPDASEDDISVPRNLDVPRMDPFRAVHAVR